MTYEMESKEYQEDQYNQSLLCKAKQMRIEVLEFAEEMEKRLREKDNEHNGNSWHKLKSPELIINLLNDKMAIVNNSKNVTDLKKILIDVANYAMMAKDIIETMDTDN